MGRQAPDAPSVSAPSQERQLLPQALSQQTSLTQWPLAQPAPSRQADPRSGLQTPSVSHAQGPLPHAPEAEVPSQVPTSTVSVSSVQLPSSPDTAQLSQELLHTESQQ